MHTVEVCSGRYGKTKKNCFCLKIIFGCCRPENFVDRVNVYHAAISFHFTVRTHGCGGKNRVEIGHKFDRHPLQ